MLKSTHDVTYNFSISFSYNEGVRKVSMNVEKEGRTIVFRKANSVYLYHLEKVVGNKLPQRETLMVQLRSFQLDPLNL